MHDDLKSVIATARAARDALIAGTVTVKEANSIAANNHTIVAAHALDLRERIFLFETARAEPARIARGETIGEEARQ